MHVILNGRLIPETEAKVSVFDRSFLYGDGLFEATRVAGGRLFRWAEHLERLRRGAEFLKIKIPFSDAELGAQARLLIAQNQMPDALLRLTLSRGVGMRGYSPQGADSPVLVMTLHPAPKVEAQNPLRWRVVTASFRLPAGEGLSQFKTCNKLPQILARAEADARGADEALLLNTNGEVVEGASSNLFWVRDGTVETPALAAGILAGVTRAVVFELCGRLGIATREVAITTGQLRGVDGVFLSLSSWGVVEVVSLDGDELRRSALVEKIRTAYDDMERNGSD